MLRRCAMCELRCGADRLGGEAAPCGLGARSHTFKRHLSLAEELELLPSYMVYLGGCNFRCSFCVQAPRCFVARGGEPVDAPELAEELRSVVARGARTINLLGGEPSLHLHTILRIAERAPGLPLVLNSNMYMTPRVLELLDGVVRLYLADLKFGNDACARELAGVDRYWAVVTRNLIRAAGQGELLVRHLLMPGHVECCLRPAAAWMAARLPGVRFHVMTSYVPAYRAARHPGPMSRTLAPEEIARAEEILTGLGYPGVQGGTAAHRATEAA